MKRSIAKTLPPMEKGVIVVNITEENEDKISYMYNGMIVNENGTLSHTPMSETWAKNRNYQLVKKYETTQKKPEYLDSIPGHPVPANYDLKWSHEGRWHDVPLKIEGNGEVGTGTRMGRVEPFIDRDGTIKMAISYGSNKETLKTWYNLEEVKRVFPNWVIPDHPRYYNSKSFNPTIRRDLGEKQKKNKTPPGDQSNSDIQGGRGRGRGRGVGGYSRGAYQPQNRGRGKATYEEEYKDWDATQTAGPSKGKKSQEDETWWDIDYSRENYREYQEKSQNRDSPGYFTRDYEDRKRARSPSPREERYSRRDRSLDRQGGRRDHYDDRREYRGDYSASRREYSPDRQTRREYSLDRQNRRDHSPRYRQDSRSRNRREYSPEEGRRYPGHNR